MDNERLIEYVRKAKAGDQAALSEICNMTYGEAGLIARSIIKDRHTCEDAIQDVYVKMIVYLPNLKNEESFLPWFKRIVANTCKDAVMKKKPMLFSSMKGDGDFEDDFDQMLVDSKSIEAPFSNEIERREMAERLLKAIKKLPEDQRICVMMHYYSEMKVDEIAKELGVSRNTVLSRLNYARKKLKKEFGDEREQYKILGALLFPAIQGVELLPEAVAVTASAEFIAGVIGIAAGTEAVTAVTTGGFVAAWFGLSAAKKAVIIVAAAVIITGAGAGAAYIINHNKNAVDNSGVIEYTTSAPEKIKVKDSEVVDNNEEEETTASSNGEIITAYRQGKHLLSENGNVFFSNNNKVYRASGDISNREELCDGNALNFVSDGEYIYFIADCQLCKYSPAENKIVNINNINAEYVACSVSSLYAVSAKNRTIYRLSPSLNVESSGSINGSGVHFIDNSLTYYSGSTLHYLDFTSSPSKSKKVGGLNKKGLQLSYSISNGKIYYPDFNSDENGWLYSKKLGSSKKSKAKLKHSFVDFGVCSGKVIYTASNGNVYISGTNGKGEKKISSKPLTFVEYSAPYALCYNPKSSKSVLVNVNSGNVMSFEDGYVDSFAVHSGYAFYTKNGVEHIKKL